MSQSETTRDSQMDQDELEEAIEQLVREPTKPMELNPTNLSRLHWGFNLASWLGDRIR